MMLLMIGWIIASLIKPMDLINHLMLMLLVMVMTMELITCHVAQELKTQKEEKKKENTFRDTNKRFHQDLDEPISKKVEKNQ